ncbi:MAG: hypothetical protein KBB52_06185 [Candidatus Omnitrophica bacterium]|nr:hypothetical protein [Candidatus Omnitrophota bacterium]
MWKTIMAALIIVCSVVIIGSFFMPWAKAVTTATKVAGGIERSLDAGPLGGSPFASKLIANIDKAKTALNVFGDVRFKTVVSGYEIPVMLNRQESKTALSLTQVFAPGAQNIGKKALLVYLLPLFALLCIALSLLAFKTDLFLLPVILISGLISTAGLYKVLTADITNNIVQITIERGLWQTLYGYLLIFIFSLLWFVLGRALVINISDKR